MARCFVIQPFDRDVFDKRYDDVFAPAIRNAGLEPYRVDRDPGVSIPIEEIESGIRDADLCFAEITTNNPNVWFELGYAIAVPKEVILVCSEDRESSFPFDIQHRNIIKYQTGAPQDFKQLEGMITRRIQAIMKKQEELGNVSKMSPVKETEGLSQHEIVALVSIMSNEVIADSMPSGYRVQKDMNNAGFTNIAFSLAIKALLAKDLISLEIQQDRNVEDYIAYSTTKKGENWLLQNQEKLVLKHPTDDIPF